MERRLETKLLMQEAGCHAPGKMMTETLADPFPVISFVSGVVVGSLAVAVASLNSALGHWFEETILPTGGESSGPFTEPILAFPSQGTRWLMGDGERNVLRSSMSLFIVG